MSSGKSGFEIRANLLAQAEGILIGNIDREYQRVYEWNANHPETKRDLPDRNVSPMEIISIAKQLNEFVIEK